MSEQAFHLLPFPASEPKPDIEISGNIVRRSNSLRIRYELNGELAKLMVPSESINKIRKDGLWEETCFEFFLSEINSTGYWEFNLSPSGNWNVYRFESYRQGMQEELAFTALPFRVTKSTEVLQVALDLNLHKILPTARPLKAALCAVIKTIDPTITYWALNHSGPQADFHLPESFAFEL